MAPEINSIGIMNMEGSSEERIINLGKNPRSGGSPLRDRIIRDVVCVAWGEDFRDFSS